MSRPVCLVLDPGQRYLLAYRFFPKPNVLELIDVAPHENFYRDLQKSLDAR